MLKRNLKQAYTPLYFLAALGPGGLAVSFFMYLMFLVPHPDAPMAALKHWWPVVAEGGLYSVLIVAAIAAFVVLGVIHFRLLAWNVKEFSLFKKTEAYQQLRQSNAEVTLMVVPLTFAMTVNMLFIIGSLFVPGLWDFVQVLFPFATLAFAAIGFWALAIYGHYIGRLFTQGDFEHDKNNNFSQLMAPFSFSMVAVGLAAPGAMSHSPVISGLSLALSSAFAGLTVVLSVVWFFAGLKQISVKGFDKVAAPTLWILIPILTLLGITFVRQSMGVHHNFAAGIDHSLFLQVMSIVLGLQVAIGLFGYRVMKHLGYLDEFVFGNKQSPVSFGLICPGVAFVVFGFFFLNYAVIGNGIIDKYSLSHLALLLPLVGVQMATTWVLLRLIKRQIMLPVAADSDSLTES